MFNRKLKREISSLRTEIAYLREQLNRHECKHPIPIYNQFGNPGSYYDINLVDAVRAIVRHLGIELVKSHPEVVCRIKNEAK
jgi:hypothetical protein